MKLRTLVLPAALVAAALAVAACTQATGSRSARLIGTHDLVLVSENTDAFLATKTLVEGGWVQVGVPSRYLFLTSADTNELRVLDNYPTVGSSRSFAAAPNPLETLSIPVLERPTMLAVDEGRDREGGRVTGAYVYAARPGGAELSVVSVRKRRQLSGRPFSTPGPVTAIGAFMAVDRTQLVDQTTMPPTTHLYVATWDGDFAAVYRAPLETNPPEEIDHLDYQRVVLIGQSPITAMLVVAPLASRTLDGAPFCAATECLALSTRVNRGTGGETFLVDPATGQKAALAFSGPVRKLVSSANGSRIYGVLDEQACGGPACGGVVAVDVVAAVTSTVPPLVPVFPASRDATGAPMAPLRSGDGLITGLTVGYFHKNVDGAQSSGTILQRTEVASADGGPGGATTDLLQEYTELGAFASSSGVITFFSGLAGSIIDYDPRRATVTSAGVRLPGALPDGGASFFTEDGGAAGSSVGLELESNNTLDDTFRVAKVIAPMEYAGWSVDLSDGYLQSQTLAFIYQGQLPGLVSLATSPADGLRLNTGGAESGAAVGDLVRFEAGNDTSGYVECGRSRIATLGAGFIEVADMPAGCGERVRFSVRADGAQPLVAVADLEGYLGRFAPGETLTYTRAFQILPAGVVAPRTALTVTIPATLPAQLQREGAVISFGINGYIVPYQVTLDTLAINASTQGGGCYNQATTQVVVGNMVMDRVPTFVSTANPLEFRWVLMGVVPSGNSMAEIILQNAHVGALTGGDLAAVCRR